jgi:hypothetical protein
MLAGSEPGLLESLAAELLCRSPSALLPPPPLQPHAAAGELNCGGLSPSPGQGHAEEGAAPDWPALEAVLLRPRPGGAAVTLDQLLAAADPAAPEGAHEGAAAGPPGLQDLPLDDFVFEGPEDNGDAALTAGPGAAPHAWPLGGHSAPPRATGAQAAAAQSAGAGWKEMLAACGWLRREPTGHLELYLDWSLLAPTGQHQPPEPVAWARRVPAVAHASVGAARHADGQQAALGAAATAGASHRGMRPLLRAAGVAALRPRATVPGPAGDAAGLCVHAAAPLRRSAGPAKGSGPGSKQAAPRTAAGQATPGDMAFFLRLGAGASAAAKPAAAPRRSGARSGAGAAASGAAKSGTCAGGGASGAAALLLVAQAAGAAGGAAASAGQQQPLDKLPPSPLREPASELAGQQLQGLAAVPPGSGSSGGGTAAATEAGPSVLTVQAPEMLGPLLEQLQAERARLLSALPNADRAPGSALASAPLWDPAPAERLLAAMDAGGGAAAASPAGKQRAQALVALLLLAQAAGALVDAGARPARLFVEHMLQQLPTLAPLMAGTAAALAQVKAQAERREGWDHPKQPALQQLLAGALAAGGKVLVVVQGKSAFSLLQPLSAAGLRGAQFDSGGALLAAAQPQAAAGDGGASAWGEAVGAALAGGADCLLVTRSHLLHPSLPLHRFDLLVEYSPVFGLGLAGASGAHGGGGQCATPGACGEESQRYEAVCARFRGRHHRLEVAAPWLAAGEPAAAARPEADAELGVPAASEGAARSRAVAAAAPSAAAAGCAPASGATAASNAPPVLEPAPGPPAEAAASDRQCSARPALPVVVSSSPAALVARRRDLYDAVLRLEQRLPGAALVERPDELADLVLTPRACVCVWGAGNLPLADAGPGGGAEGGLQLMARRLLQLSFAFAEVHFILELPQTAPPGGPQQHHQRRPQQPGVVATAAAALLRQSHALHGVARAAGVRLCLHPVAGSAATQVRGRAPTLLPGPRLTACAQRTPQPLPSKPTRTPSCRTPHRSCFWTCPAPSCRATGACRPRQPGPPLRARGRHHCRCPTTPRRGRPSSSPAPRSTRSRQRGSRGWGCR